MAQVNSHISAFQSKTARVSSRQFALLRALEQAPRTRVHIEELMGWNQQTVGSCKQRGFIIETRDKHGMEITPDGKKALNAYRTADFYRKISSFHFSTHVSLEPPANLLKSFERLHPKRKAARASGGAQAHDALHMAA